MGHKELLKNGLLSEVVFQMFEQVERTERLLLQERHEKELQKERAENMILLEKERAERWILQERFKITKRDLKATELDLLHVQGKLNMRRFLGKIF
jgi:hypothetical protein